MNFNWDELTAWITNNTEFECAEEGEYIVLYFKNSPTEIDPCHAELEKEKVKTVKDLQDYFKGEYEDFSADDFCRYWLNAKNAGALNVPEIHKLLEQADYMEDCFEDVIVKLSQKIFLVGGDTNLRDSMGGKKLHK